MATYYVKSTATGTGDGLSWANAFLTLAAAAAVDVAGDTIYVSQAHSESTATTLTLSWAGTSSSPTKIICVEDSSEPPITVANTAIVSTTISSSITMNGVFYSYGVSLDAGSGSGSGIIVLSNTVGNSAFIEAASLRRVGTNGTSGMTFGNAGTVYGTSVTLKNCSIYFSNAAQSGIRCEVSVNILGGSVEAGSATPTGGVFSPASKGSNLSLDGFDFSNFASTLSPFRAEVSGTSSTSVMRNCKMPSNWSGTLYGGTINVIGQKFEMYNCDSGDTNYRLWIESYAGTLRDETAVVRIEGASDATTPLSWRIISSSTSSYPLVMLESPEIVIWNDTVGSNKTVTVEVLTDGVTLTDEDCWLEVQYLGTNGFPLSKFISDAKADVLAAPADQSLSSASWVTTGLTSPVTQKLSVTFTPQEKGFVQAKVVLAKPSTTVYVCPKARLT